MNVADVVRRLIDVETTLCVYWDEAVVQEYLPVILHPPDYPTCKDNLDFLIEVIDELAIPFIYVDSVEMVHSKLCEILWKNRDIYNNIILLTRGFHELRVMQWLQYKRHFPKGHKESCVDAKTIEGGSILSKYENA